MSTNFPSALDVLTNPVGTDYVDTVDHASQHANVNDAVEALQAKVGINASAVTTSHDYKLGEILSSDKAVGKTATQTLTNKTLTSPTITSPTISGATNTGTDSGTQTLANKTLTTPTIADFTNATHAHTAASSGGQLNASSVFSAGTVPTARLGSGTANSSTYLRGDQTWQAISISSKFGGSGADGALSFSSGTQNIDLGNAAIVVKNYTLISITGTGKLTFTNPNTNGTIIILKSQGAVTLTSSGSPCIDASGMGGAAGSGASSQSAVPASITRVSNMVTTIAAQISNAGGIAPVTLGITNVKDLLMSPGQGGSGGGINSASANGNGGGGGASLINNGSAGQALGGNTAGSTPRAGGRGGGALYIECGGAYTNTAATVTTAGLPGTAAGASGEGGAGGGGAGTLYILYGSLVSDTGTYTYTGGAAGAASGGGSAGGAGATSYSFVGLNPSYT